MIPDGDDKVGPAHVALTQETVAERAQHSSAYTTPIDTAVTSGPPDRSTPRAQTRQDYEEDIKRRSVRMSVNLAGTSISLWTKCAC